MTALVGASVFLIAGSAIALVFGWITADESLIWTSIGATVAGGICLALAWFRSREEVSAAGRAAEQPASRRPATRRPSATAHTGSAEPERQPDAVVGIPRSKRFHRPGCRYAAAKGAQNMTKADALKAGFTPCGICKP